MSMAALAKLIGSVSWQITWPRARTTNGRMNMADGLRHVEPGLGEAWWVVGDTYTFKATGDDTGGALALSAARVPPQGGPPPHIHDREDEFYYLLDGALQVRDGDRLFTAEPGSFVFVPRGRLHCFHNDSHVPARVLIGITQRVLRSSSLPSASGLFPARRRHRLDQRRWLEASILPRGSAWKCNFQPSRKPPAALLRQP
jgi:mannose-6-phosphate isomerase-like protein (cupin superfamily)